VIKQIKSSELSLGMYIDKLEVSWIDHPFLRNRFKINTLDDIRRIRKSGVKYVNIDTEKGVDVAPQSDIEQRPKKAEPVVESRQKPSYTPVSVTEELARARRVMQEAVRVISDFKTDIRLGKQVDYERVCPLVEGMLGSIFRNQDALLGLTRIRQMDKYTFEHSISVSVLLIAFAKTLGLDESMIWELGIGGLLHDIGKLQVPDEILNKPGRLTDQEFATMQNHVVFGSRLLGDATAIPGKAKQVIRQHHERMDGNGYPNRLSAEEISLYGKMAAIVDVYDAITSDRVYHKGKLPNIVLSQLLEWSRKNIFDAQLVQRFVQCVGIYPVGTLVALQSGRVAIVEASSPDALLTPVVKVIYDIQRASYLTPKLVDLAEHSLRTGESILKAVDAKAYGIDLASFLAE
jgi:putative nucleotidyltransferase with HDIG domain